MDTNDDGRQAEDTTGGGTTRAFGRWSALAAVLLVYAHSDIDGMALTGGLFADSSAETSAVDALVANPAREPLRSFLEPGVPEDVTAAVSARLAVAGLLSPEGFERPRWRSFDHVVPVPSVPKASVDGERFTVAIDPGHGGTDPGAEGPNGLLEKHLTLDIARRARLFLSELDDIEIVLTRERDRGLSRASRVHAVRASGADLFVSLHFNHLPQSEVTLVESFYAGPENIAESRALRAARAALSDPHRHVAATTVMDDGVLTRGSERFATLVQRRVHDEVSRDNDAAEDAGVKRETLFVLTRSEISGALVELTCLSNAGEAERLTDPDYRDRLAAALADAIRDYRDSLDEAPLDGTDV